MEKENWKKVKELLLEALSLEPSERREFLQKSGAGAEILQEVESLIAFEDAAEGLMNLSAIEFSKKFFDEDEPANALVGQRFGVYTIVRELGYGGMGAVYLAERNDGKFEQKVALKLLRREMNTSALRNRFRQEREILASLEHPHIARLLDAGTTDDNIPFLAMEYVEGVPIDDYCNTHNLDLTAKLDLFRTVCATVNFAHRNLIVHRDLKPSNILVNEEGSPKLLDFGISKILSNDLPSADSATITKLGVMTPGYASPEQLRNESVTTATDIYSLGVILYELLSGHRPFETKEKDLQEIYQAVIELDPLPPSAVITDSGLRIADSESKTIPMPKRITNQKRETNPQSQIRHPQLKGDLDNIVLKALRKEPERRYSSAENLAEDIRRHQAGLPVTARPNTFAYRAEKFIKRNKVAVIAASLISLAIIGGIIATLWQARVAQAERAKAEKRFGDVRKLANSYLFDVFPEVEDLEGSLKAREKILKTAFEYLDSLSNEAEGDLELQGELATAYEKIGEVQGAVNITNMGDINGALESYKKAQKLREAAFAAAPKNPEIKEALAKNYQVYAQTIQWNIDTASAAEYFDKAIKLRRELVAENPDSVTFRNRLAVLISDSAAIPLFNVENEKAAQKLDESATILKEILKTTPDHFYSQKAYPRILRADSHLKSNIGDFDGALEDIEQSVVLTDELMKSKPQDASLKRTAWLNDFAVCQVYAARRDGKKIVESCLKTVDFNLETLETEPDEAFALYDLATSYYEVARGYRLSGEANRSIEYAQKALEIMTKLDKLAPGTNDYQRVLGNIEADIADSQMMLDQPEKALENLQKAQSKLEKVVATDNSVTAYQAELANVYRSLAKATNKTGEKAKALEFVDKAIAIAAKLKAQDNLIYSEKNMPDELAKEKAEYAN